MTYADRMKEIESRISICKRTPPISALSNALVKDVDFLLSRVKELEAASKAVCDAFAEWESVRTLRNDINSHEWLALVAAITAMEAKNETPAPPD